MNAMTCDMVRYYLQYLPADTLKAFRTMNTDLRWAILMHLVTDVQVHTSFLKIRNEFNMSTNALKYILNAMVDGQILYEAASNPKLYGVTNMGQILYGLVRVKC